MKTLTKYWKTFTIALVVLFFLLLAGLIYVLVGNKNLVSKLDTERLKTEKLMSSELSMHKQLEMVQKQVAALSDRNSELKKKLDDAVAELNDTEARLKRVAKENGNIKALKNEIANISQVKENLEKQVAEFGENIRMLDKEKNNLEQRMVALQEENLQLNESLEILSSLTTDNYLVETTKRNDKLTIFARRTRKISMSFNVPEKVARTISFKLIKPDGSKINGEQSNISYRVVDEDRGTLASNSGGLPRVMKKIEMTYSPVGRQKPGIYKVEMYNGDKYLAAFNIKLR